MKKLKKFLRSKASGSKPSFGPEWTLAADRCYEMLKAIPPGMPRREVLKAVRKILGPSLIFVIQESWLESDDPSVLATLRLIEALEDKKIKVQVIFKVFGPDAILPFIARIISLNSYLRVHLPKVSEEQRKKWMVRRLGVFPGPGVMELDAVIKAHAKNWQWTLRTVVNFALRDWKYIKVEVMFDVALQPFVALGSRNLLIGTFGRFIGSANAPVQITNGRSIQGTHHLNEVRASLQEFGKPDLHAVWEACTGFDDRWVLDVIHQVKLEFRAFPETPSDMSKYRYYTPCNHYD